MPKIFPFIIVGVQERDYRPLINMIGVRGYELTVCYKVGPRESECPGIFLHVVC